MEISLLGVLAVLGGGFLADYLVVVERERSELVSLVKCAGCKLSKVLGENSVILGGLVSLGDQLIDETGFGSPRKLDEPNRKGQIAQFNFIANSFCFSDGDTSVQTSPLVGVRAQVLRSCCGRLLEANASGGTEARATVTARTLGGYELVGISNFSGTQPLNRAYEFGVTGRAVAGILATSMTFAWVGRHVAGQTGVIFQTNWGNGYSLNSGKLSIALAASNALTVRMGSTTNISIAGITGDYAAVLQYNSSTTVWTLSVRRPGQADVTATFTGSGGLFDFGDVRFRLMQGSDGTGLVNEVYGGALGFFNWEHWLGLEYGQSGDTLAQAEARAQSWYLSELQRIAGF